MNTPINPKHYKENGYGMELIDMMLAVFGKEKVSIFCTINAFKYRMRAGKKEGNPAEQDLKKERWYIEKSAELMPQAPTPSPIGAAQPAKKVRDSKPTWTPERLEQLKGMSVPQAAKRFGVKESYIHALRHKYGIARKYNKGKKKAPKPAVIPAKKSLKSQYEGTTHEEEQNRHEAAKRVAAEHGARAVQGKVGVRVDGRTTVLMSPKKAEEFKRRQQAAHDQE